MPALKICSDLPTSDLRRLARRESDGRVCRRLLAIAMALDGASREESARQAGMDRQTLRDWVVRYNAEGVEGLRDRARTGRPPLLANALESELADLIAAGPDVERDGDGRRAAVGRAPCAIIASSRPISSARSAPPATPEPPSS